MAPTAADADEDDPVVTEYDVFITPEIQEQLYVLQYLNRPPDERLVEETGTKPSSLRIKPQSGFVEVDVPVDIRNNFNRQMGVRWGEALRKTKQIGQKAYGIAAGFERTMPRPPRPAPSTAVDNRPTPTPGPTLDDDNYDDYITNFEDANEKGHVLNTQTYGGQIQPDDGKGPNYMLGSFRNNELHLTKLKGLVQMRTQFHHIDALAQLDAVNRRREKEQQEGAKTVEPKAFMPTVKRAGGDTAAEVTQALMKATNQEKWQRLEYEDDDSGTAYATYADCLFVNNTDVAPKLHAEMSNSEYLNTVSAPSGGKGIKKKLPHKRQELVEISDESDEEDA
ncbi:hypothetical protein DM02DRAFT_276554 [Periconia macrospinosa]|uniref:Uncharacterized protein n=1 Tax=Periconia macrospinosa TaxID=97972 RepID=A0A2V1D489_9PLEO|nr:hypothetical protein DM02DRAFT_276554 [Periconia macrospinosa]